MVCQFNSPKNVAKKQQALESFSPSDDGEEVNELNEVQHDQLVPSLPEDFLSETLERFSLDHDYLLELSLHGAVSKCRWKPKKTGSWDAWKSEDVRNQVHMWWMWI